MSHKSVHHHLPLPIHAATGREGGRGLGSIPDATEKESSSSRTTLLLITRLTYRVKPPYKLTFELTVTNTADLLVVYYVAVFLISWRFLLQSDQWLVTV